VTGPTPNVCARPGCDRPPRPFTGRGRPPLYCSDTCRHQAARRPDRDPVLVEITHQPTTRRQRPVGRVWTVQLRRGARTVTVAADLGHASARSLADQIAEILHTNPTNGAAID
jgi:hypothetical protein